MVDATKLLTFLQEYELGMTSHLAKVQEEFETLELYWRQLSECYEGASAQEFREVWQGSERMFRDYLERSRVIGSVLSVRIESLRLYDQE